MNEPKRRGRPPKAKLLQPTEPNARIEGADAPKCPECGWVVGHYDDCGRGIAGPVLNGDTTREPETVLPSKAQAYAERVWNGQNRDLPRNERLARVRRALEGQNLPFEGVVL